jgi:hypothetical protein
VTKIPLAAEIPEGRVLVHNHIRHTPRTLPGENGFRVWLDYEGEDNLVVCKCH